MASSHGIEIIQRQHAGVAIPKRDAGIRAPCDYSAVTVPRDVHVVERFLAPVKRIPVATQYDKAGLFRQSRSSKAPARDTWTTLSELEHPDTHSQMEPPVSQIGATNKDE